MLGCIGSRWARRATLGIAALATLAGCGSASAGGVTPSPSPNIQAQALAFAQCMRSHGVNMPDPQVSGSGSGAQFSIRISDSGGSGPGKGSPAMQAAMSACQKYMPRFGGPGSQTPDPQRQAQMLQFSQCMRTHGIADFPDPSGGGVILQGGPNSNSDINPSSPVFQSAQQACQHFLPERGQQQLNVQDGGAGPGGGSGEVISGSSN
jgi:hypothetical protein